MNKISIDELKIIHEYCDILGIGSGVLFDIGGHFGESSIPFLEEGWTSYCFEPDPANREILLKNTQKFSNLNVYDFALSDIIESNVPFYNSNESSGISSLLEFHHTHELATHVQTKRIDQFCEEQNVLEIDILKIDTEGSDFKILSSFDFGKIKPEVILCEYDFKKTDNYENILKILKENNYEVIISEWDPIVKYGIQHSWNSFKVLPDPISNYQSWGNIIAFKEKINFSALLTATTKSRNRIVSEPIKPQQATPQPLPLTLTQRLEKLKEKGFCKVALYGAGKFTRQILENHMQNQTLKVLTILDDKFEEIKQVKGIQVINPSSFNSNSVDAVILSTDTHQKAMKQRCIDLNISIPVIDIFKEFD